MEKGAFGSLTLGGYDSSRFDPSKVSFTLAEDISRDLVVGVQSITLTIPGGATTELLPSSSAFPAFIDSTVPNMYLPSTVCEHFEQALGLQWNETWNTYLLSDSTHSNLTKKNPSITLQIGNNETSTSTVNITLPYASLDLKATPPLVTDPTNYFPLKRAMNESQYTLGRVFLQEA